MKNKNNKISKTQKFTIKKAEVIKMKNRLDKLSEINLAKIKKVDLEIKELTKIVKSAKKYVER